MTRRKSEGIELKKMRQIAAAAAPVVFLLLAAAPQALAQGRGAVAVRPYVSVLSHVWLIVITLGAAAWLGALNWINADAESVRENPNLWNLLFLSVGIFSFCIAWLLPYPALSVGIFLLLVGGAYTTYVVVRNARVPYEDKVWTTAHIYGLYRSLLSQLGMRAYSKAAEKQSKREVTQVPVTLIGGDGSRQESDAVPGKSGSALQAVKYLIYEAVQNRVTDIHLEPKGSSVAVRYRIDGILHNTEPLPRDLGISTISSIKVLSTMDISERRRPQDGSFSAELPGKTVDVRVATNPSVEGERMMMRVLDRSSGLLSVTSLGMTKRMQQDLLKFTASPNGMMIVTGPTGHGKTTTLYALLNKIDAFQRNVVTIEDPVEYRLENISQTAINPKAGITFAGSLRSMLRQDPDVILVGEIRDQETADIGMRAAMTGHLVFSTVHANDAVSVIFRLLDLGIEPYLISSAITCILSQRLVRVLCNNCKAPYRPKREFLEKAGLPADRVEVLYKPVGCERCQGTGFYGRTAIFEYLTFNDELRDMIRSNPSVTQLYRSARKSGMRTIEENGLLCVARGVTSVKELLRVTRSEHIREQESGEGDRS